MILDFRPVDVTDLNPEMCSPKPLQPNVPAIKLNDPYKSMKCPYCTLYMTSSVILGCGCVMCRNCL
jgi:hypothetical protein